MRERWRDATKKVQVKGPFTSPEPADQHGYPDDIEVALDSIGEDAYYIILERDGRKRFLPDSVVEERYNIPDE